MPLRLAFCALILCLLPSSIVHADAPSGGYCCAQSKFVSYLRLTHIGDHLSGFLQFIYADGTTQGYEVQYSNVEGIWSGNTIFLSDNAAVNVIGQGDGHISGDKIIFTVPLNDGTIRTVSFSPMAPQRWNVVVHNFKLHWGKQAIQRDATLRVLIAYNDYLVSLQVEKEAQLGVITCRQELLKDEAIPDTEQQEVAGPSSATPTNPQDTQATSPDESVVTKKSDDQEALSSELSQLASSSLQLTNDAAELSTTSAGRAKLRAISVNPPGLPVQLLSKNAFDVYATYRGCVATYGFRLTPEQVDTMTTTILLNGEINGVDPRLIIAVLLSEDNPANIQKPMIALSYHYPKIIDSLAIFLKDALRNEKGQLNASVLEFAQLHRDGLNLKSDETPEDFAKASVVFYSDLCGAKLA